MSKRQSKANVYETNWISPSKAIQYMVGTSLVLCLTVFLSSRGAGINPIEVVFSGGIIGVVAFLWLGRGAFKLELKPSELVWHSAFSTHQVKYDRLRMLRPFTLMPRVAVLEAKGNVIPILVFMRHDFGPTLERLQHKAPELKVRITIPDEKHHAKKAKESGVSESRASRRATKKAGKGAPKEADVAASNDE